jgi:hypothetical protein
MPVPLLLLLRTSLAIWDLLWFHKDFRITFFYFYEKHHENFGTDDIESVYHFK